MRTQGGCIATRRKDIDDDEDASRVPYLVSADCNIYRLQDRFFNTDCYSGNNLERHLDLAPKRCDARNAKLAIYLSQYLIPQLQTSDFPAILAPGFTS